MHESFETNTNTPDTLPAPDTDSIQAMFEAHNIPWQLKDNTRFRAYELDDFRLQAALEARKKFVFPQGVPIRISIYNEAIPGSEAPSQTRSIVSLYDGDKIIDYIIQPGSRSDRAYDVKKYEGLYPGDLPTGRRLRPQSMQLNEIAAQMDRLPIVTDADELTILNAMLQSAATATPKVEQTPTALPV